MKNTHNPITKAIRIALYSSLFSSLSLSHFAIAQNNEEEADTESLESITVIGSNIRGVDLEGAHPVTIIERKDLIRTGVTDVGDLLQRLPSFNGSPIGTRTNNGGNGSVRVDLRGIGTGRTLVLVNGKRSVDGGDFQTIPASMIERVEILKEGASAIYGADAVAGVVNIITRKEIDGAEVSVRYSDSFDTNNADNKQASVVFGKTNDRGFFSFGFDYEVQSAILQADLPYEFTRDTFAIVDADAYAQGGFDPDADYLVRFGSSRIPCGRFVLASGGPALVIDGPSPGAGDCGPPGQTLTPEDFRPYVGFGPNNDSYNFAPINFLQTPFDKTNVFFNASRDINEKVTVYSSMRYNHRTSSQRLAPLPYDSRFGLGAPVTGGVAGISADNVYNPFGEDIVDARRRMVETNRIFAQDVQQHQGLIGAKGLIGESSWTWDASYNFGFRQVITKTSGQLLGSRLASALGPSFFNEQGVAICGTPDAPIAGCVPLNLFGGPGTVTPEMLSYLEANLVDSFEAQLDVFNVNFSGILFDLPAGPVGSAFGLEYRDQGSDTSPDSNKVIGAVTGNTGPGVAGSYDVTSLYGEVNLPVFESSSLGKLDAIFGARYDDYSTIGSNTTVQGNFVWRLNESLLLRATYAEVFREPGINALFSGQNDSAPPAQDPCNDNPDSGFATLTPAQQAVCIAQGVPDGGYTQTDTQLRSRIGGNPNLKPEQGDTMTIGLAWSPTFLEGFTATLDWWSVDLDDGINNLDIDTIILSCLNSGSASSSECSNVMRRANGSIDFVLDLNNNAANVKVEGIDVSLDYKLNTDYGRFSTSLQWTHLLTRETTDFTGGTPNDFLGRHDIGNRASYFENQAKFALNWNYGNWSTSYLIDYFSGITADVGNGIPGEQEIGSQVYTDLVVSYALPWYESTVSVAINNVFDKAPPYLSGGFNATTDPSTFRLFGRSFSVSWNSRF